MFATIKRFTLWSHLLRSIVNMKLNLTVILPVVLHGHETSSVILKKEQELTPRGLTCSGSDKESSVAGSYIVSSDSDLHFGGK
jgi:hypothetical protein